MAVDGRASCLPLTLSESPEKRCAVTRVSGCAGVGWSWASVAGEIFNRVRRAEDPVLVLLASGHGG